MIEGVKRDRYHSRVRRLSFWDYSNDATDYATARIPGLLRDRMDELGIDFNGFLWRVFFAF